MAITVVLEHHVEFGVGGRCGNSRPSGNSHIPWLVINDFAEDLDAKRELEELVAEAFAAVSLHHEYAEELPFWRLSESAKDRADMAMLLLLYSPPLRASIGDIVEDVPPSPLIIDEFTSSMDRQLARRVAAGMAAYWRKVRAENQLLLIL